VMNMYSYCLQPCRSADRRKEVAQSCHRILRRQGVTLPEQKEGRLPDFLCIGAQKAGTTWLDTNLRDHPDIWMPPIKELHYFDHLYIPRNRRWTEGHIRKKVIEALSNHVTNSSSADMQLIEYLVGMTSGELFTEAWYRRLFDYPDARNKTIGEITPAYSTIPPKGIRFMRDFLESPRIIYIIRHPVTRAASQIRMNLKNRDGVGKHGDSEELTKAEWLNLVNNPDVQHRGRYSEYVPAWCKYFDEQHLLFVAYSRIGKEPDTVLREIEYFLNLKAFGNYPKAARRVHVSKKKHMPDFVMDAIEESMAPEVRFLEKRFGKKFVALT